jgi:hypothetical protein
MRQAGSGASRQGVVATLSSVYRSAQLLMTVRIGTHHF